MVSKVQVGKFKGQSIKAPAPIAGSADRPKITGRCATETGAACRAHAALIEWTTGAFDQR